MRLLIIDNGTNHLDRLQAMCTKHEVTTVGIEQFMSELAGTDLDGYDAVIVSGDYGDGLAWDQDYFINETELVAATGKPLLGIGIGFELICYAFGCQLHEEAERAAGAAKLTPTDDGAKIFQGSDPLRVAEGQRWNVEDLPRGLVVLARSDSGIEAVKHKTKPIYGLQVGPDGFSYASDGKMVFANILELLQKQA